MVIPTTLYKLRSDFQKGKLSKADFIDQSQNIHNILFEYRNAIHNSDISSITITEEELIFEFESLSISLAAPPNDLRSAPIEALNFGFYEPSETKLLANLALDAKCIIDVGANIGFHANLFSKINPNAQIYAFEPAPLSYSYLQRNIALNGLGSKVYTFNYGLSDTLESVKLVIPSGNSANASLINVSQATDFEECFSHTTTLDIFCSNYFLKPSLIKCDVEGAELMVLKGGCDTLKQFKPIVFAELLRKWSKPFGYHPNDMIDFMSSMNYLCIAISNEGYRKCELVNDDTSETNYLFLNKENHSQLISNFCT